MLIDQRQEMVVEKFESGGEQLLSGWGKGLRGELPQQVGAVPQVGEERIAFRLRFRREAAEQAGYQAGQAENTGL